MNQTTAAQPHRRGVFAWLLFLLAIGLLAAAVIVWTEPAWLPDDLPLIGNTTGGAAVPSPERGQNQYIHVVRALDEAGLDVTVPERVSGRVDGLAVVGQGIRIDGQDGYVFLFKGSADRAAAEENLDTDSITVVNPSGTPTVSGAVVMAGNSNVLVLVSSDDQDLADRVDEALDTLP